MKTSSRRPLRARRFGDIPALAAALLFLACASSQRTRSDYRTASPAPAAAPDETAQHAAHEAMGHAHHGAGDVEKLHMERSPTRSATRDDSARALAVVRELRTTLARYADTAAAARDGYRMFAPHLEVQRTYHFTRTWNAVLEAFRWNAGAPTSLLYERDASGALRLVGAMYTMPKGAPVRRLDSRIPTSIARWHKHVNWCLPPRSAPERWTETRDGQPVFGPLSPIATRDRCDAVGGRFESTLFGWMVHVNAFAGDDLAAAFGDHHAGAR